MEMRDRTDVSVAHYVLRLVSQMLSNVSDQIVDFLQGKREIVFVRVSVMPQSLRDSLSNRPKRLQAPIHTVTSYTAPDWLENVSSFNASQIASSNRGLAWV